MLFEHDENATGGQGVEFQEQNRSSTNFFIRLDDGVGVTSTDVSAPRRPHAAVIDVMIMGRVSIVSVISRDLG